MPKTAPGLVASYTETRAREARGSAELCRWCLTPRDKHFKGWMGTLYCYAVGGDHTWGDPVARKAIAEVGA